MARLSASEVEAFISNLFEALGVPRRDSAEVATAIVAADLEGIASHGVMLLPMYVDRLRSGSVIAEAKTRIVEDHGGLVILSAEHGLGQISSRIAVATAVERANIHGTATVAVRHGFHFGAASYWTRMIAAAGMIGFAFSNTRPLMPPPGGSERVVGNNPLSIAFPSADEKPVVVDMAMSATAMGKIRLAEARGDAIPEGWATDSAGNPTRSPSEAIAGMLLPAAGPKGFGLAVAIDLLSGALSGGAVGGDVRPLYGDPSVPYDCAHTFIAIDAGRLIHSVGRTVSGLADTIRGVKPAGDMPPMAPGDIERKAREASGEHVTLPKALVETLNRLAAEVGAVARLSTSDRGE
jgi:LDH2 family malate/lactate/ureidoglycolate dehydrogenase